MNNSLERIGFSIFNQVKGYYISNNTNLEIDLVYHTMSDVRSILLKEEFDSRKYLDPSVYMQECCLEIQCRELSCNGIGSGEFEKYVNVNPVETFLGEQAIKYFGGIDKKTPWAKRSVNGGLFAEYNQFTNHIPYFMRIGRTEYILGNVPDGMKYVCEIKVLEDVLDQCKPSDPFPIPGVMIHKLELLCIKQLLSVIGVKFEDRNDTRDDLASQVPKQGK